MVELYGTRLPASMGMKLGYLRVGIDIDRER
jgi:hypothetical protein